MCARVLVQMLWVVLMSFAYWQRPSVPVKVKESMKRQYYIDRAVGIEQQVVRDELKVSLIRSAHMIKYFFCSAVSGDSGVTFAGTSACLSLSLVPSATIVLVLPLFNSLSAIVLQPAFSVYGENDRF